VEADFLREYGVHLDREMPDITWRKFMVLVRCLSPNAATINLLRPAEYIGGKKDRAVTVEGKGAEQAFMKSFAPPKEREPAAPPA
jgi:hypothetical protein